MRNRLTKQAMGKDDSPTTMHVEQMNPDVSKYETGNPSSWAEDVHMDSPWDAENAPGGREETGHPKKVREDGKNYTANHYASAVKEAQNLEEKALRCLKMAEVILGEEAPTDVVERQAVDFMTMSNKSVLATLRRMREFEENISEARVAKIVDAVLEVIAEDGEEEEKMEEKKAEEEMEEEKVDEKKASEEDEDAKIAAIVEATLEVIAEEEEEEKKDEEKKDASKEEEEEEEKKDSEGKCATEETSLEEKVAALVLEALKKEAGEDKEEEMEEEKKDASEEKVAEEEEEKEEEKKDASEEATTEASQEITFEEGNDVMASSEDEALLSQIFTTKEAEEETSNKEAKIKTLKNVTASKEGSEIDKLASLWNKEL